MRDKESRRIIFELYKRKTLIYPVKGRGSKYKRRPKHVKRDH